MSSSRLRAYGARKVTQPLSTSELADLLRMDEPIHIVGSGTRIEWELPRAAGANVVSTSLLSGIIDYSPNDQVVNVRAGTSLSQLQVELEAQGQCLPLVPHDHDGTHQNLTGTVAGALSLNLPHLLEGECGSWRDWVLGMTIVLADGTIAKSGSHAVKNVAGYDIHKLMIGARGSLAVVAEVILRTYPIKSLPVQNVRITHASGAVEGSSQWIQRVKRSDFAAATAVSSSFRGIDVAGTATLFRWLPEGLELPRFDGDWVLRSNSGDQNLLIHDPTVLLYMKRAKAIFDPTGKLNSGSMGIREVLHSRVDPG